MDKNIYVIHENDEWLVPLRESFKKIKAPFKEWHMDKESFDFKKSPPNGIFYNRMSASAHSRGHRYAPENTKDVLSWLEKDKKRIVNNSRALELEISKQKQYEELKKFNINFPETYYAKNKNEILEKSKNFKKSFITKHNRGGRGLGVKYFKNTSELEKYINGNFEDSIDGKPLKLHYKKARFVNKFPMPEQGEIKKITYDNSEPLKNELKYFISNLFSERIEMASGDSALDVIKILEDSTKSLKKYKSER